MERVIELEGKDRAKSINLKWCFIKYGGGLVVVGVLGIMVWLGAEALKEEVVSRAMAFKDNLIQSVSETKLVREVVYIKPESLETKELIRKISKEMGIRSVVVESVVEKESGFRDSAIRFEPAQYERLKKRPDYRAMSDDQVRMYASSHGLGQIMGFNIERCGLKSWAELYDRDTNIRCSITIIKDNMHAAKHLKSPADRLWAALKAYNGRGEMAEAYADGVFATITKKLLNDVGEGL